MKRMFGTSYRFWRNSRILIAGISGDEAPKNENQMAAVRSNASSRRKVPPQVNDDWDDPEMS